MKKLTFFLISLLTVFAFAACSDGLDNIEYNRNSDIVIVTPEVTTVTGTSLTVTSSVTGNINQVVKKGFCYSINAQNPTIKDNIVDADENFSATISGLTGNTSYYIRSYVYGNSRYTYSDVLTATTGSQSLDEQLKNYVAPAYEDNYIGIAAWNQRSKWNLANVHDPTVMKADDGYYYMYQTDASYGNAHSGNGHFHARRSRDLVNWEYLGATMTETPPTWIKEKLNAYRAEMGLEPIDSPSYGYWAPVARKVATGKYRMYYSIVITNYIKTGKPEVDNNGNFDGSWTERAFIGLMETADPASNIWEDKGFVVCSASDKGKTDYGRVSTSDWNGYFKINAIDPTYIITENGEHWMIYGSWHSGIAALQLNPEDGMPLHTLGNPWDITGENNSGYGKIIATRGNSRWQASEGPEVIYRNGYYNLFLAYGTLAVEYNTRVCRSVNIDGPYVDMDGTPAMGSGELYPILTAPYLFNNSYGWVGISHCGIFEDGEGNWFYTSQGRFPANVGGNEYSNAIMMGHVRSIRWDANGWPLVMPERYGAVPQVPITEEEIAGNWEHLSLTSSTSTQRTSETLTFDAGTHKISSGSWKDASWTFDAASQTITTSAGVVLYLQREVDWEATPRTHTIVYAAQGNKKTYWGKKVQ